MLAQPEIKIVADKDELSRVAAEEFGRAATAAVEDHGRFTVALSGGSTPRKTYTRLAEEAELPWDHMYFFWSDERHVPPNHPDSNYRMARETLLSRVPIAADHVFRIPAEERNAAVAADLYEQTLKQFFMLGGGSFPRFDLVLLGLGPDGHTASLYPETAALHEHSRLVVANWVEKLNAWRITLTLPVLNNAAEVVFLVSGKDKAQALREVLKGSGTPEQYPAKLIQPTDGKLLWLVDSAAAELL